MSYSRFGEADVYVFHSSGGFGTCMLCNLMPMHIVKEGISKGSTFNDDYNTQSRKEMIIHLKEHLRNGDMVPNRAIDKIEQEIEEVGDIFEE